MHVIEPCGRRKRDIVRTLRPDLVARFDDCIAEIVEQLALVLIGLHCSLNLIDRPAGDFTGFLVAALDYALLQSRHALGCARPVDVIAITVGEENGFVDIAVALGPERIVIPVIPRPQREVEEITISVWPEPRTEPPDVKEVMVTPPVLMPPVMPERVEGRLLGEVAPCAEEDGLQLVLA